MVFIDGAPSSIHIDGQRRVGKCSKHAIRTTKLRKRAFYSICFSFRVLSLIDLIFLLAFNVERAPEQACPSRLFNPRS